MAGEGLDDPAGAEPGLGIYSLFEPMWGSERTFLAGRTTGAKPGREKMQGA